MASKEHWEMDPWNDAEVMQRVVGKDFLDLVDVREQLKQILGPRRGVRCLEIGAGFGRLLPYVQSSFFQCFGVDSSISLVAKSTNFLRLEANCRVVLNDGKTFPFPDNFFDFVYSFTCFQHMNDLETIIRNLLEAYRVLNLDQVCRIQTVCGDRNEAGRYDGYVFKSCEEFGRVMSDVGFVNVKAYLDGHSWIWATGEKKCAK